MSFIQVRDQFGNPPAAPCDRLSVQLIPDDWVGGHGAQDDRFTDNAGNTSFPGAEQLWPASGYTLTVNKVNVDAKYGSTEKHVTAKELEASPITLTVQKTDAPNPPQPGTCPVNYDKQQFTTWFFGLVTKYNEPIVSTSAMGRMANDLVACGMLWQNQGIYPVDQWRPRIHQAPIRPDHDSDHNVDCGDFGLPWKLTFRY